MVCGDGMWKTGGFSFQSPRQAGCRRGTGPPRGQLSGSRMASQAPALGNNLTLIKCLWHFFESPRMCLGALGALWSCFPLGT